MDVKRKVFKLLVIGDTAVGKTSLLARLRGEEPSAEHTATIGVDFFNHHTTVNGRDVTLQVWDTAGQERFMSITATFFRGAQGVLLVYDVTRRESFENINKWMQCVVTSSGGEGLEKLLIGNKCDLEAQRQVPRAEGEELARSLGVRFFESSAKTGDNAAEVFVAMAEHLVQLHDARSEAEASAQSALDMRARECGAQAAGARSGGCC